MKTRLLFLLTLALNVQFAKAANYTWTGSGATRNWSNSANWSPSSGYPMAGDAVTIPNTTNKPTVDVLSACATITITGSTTITLSAPLNLSGGLAIGGNGFTLNIAGTNTITLAGITSIAYQSQLIVAAGATVKVSAGSTVETSGSQRPIINNGDFVLLSGCTMNLTFATGFTNSGKLTTTSSTINFKDGGNNDKPFNNTGTIIDHASTYNMSNGADNITNSGSGSFTGHKTTINLASGTSNINNAGGTFTLDSGSVVNLSSFGSSIKNAGTFNAGVSGSLCTINLLSQPSNTGTGASIYNSGTFNLGPSSIIVFGTSYQQSVNNTGTFTLKSDASGTASISAMAIGQQQILSGIYTVERYITGGSASNRSWRLMSSPVNNSTTIPLSTSASYDFSSLKKNILVTGPGGSANGFDPSPTNGPTILLYNTATKLFEIPGSITATAKAGRGFYFYFRGDNINNTVAKVTKAATIPYYPTPEANIVALQTGTLNQQNFTYGLTIGGNGWNQVGNPYPSTININPASGSGVLTNTNPFIWTYNSGGNSINAQSASTNIASGQGFFVKVATGATSASINFTESLKTSAQPIGPSLLMGKPIGTQEPIISLKLTHDSVNYDISHLRFLDTYKKEYDEMEDADKLNGQGQAVFFSAITSDNRQVAIASQPLDKQKTSIFLSVNDNIGGLVSISKMDLTGIPEAYDVWLMDHFKKDSLDIRANDNYNFNIDKANPDTYGNARFEVVIRKKSLPPYQLTSFTGARKGTDVAINWNTKNEYNYTEFEVQKSTDGVTFNAVKNIQSSSMGSYTYKDIETNPTTGNIYYRLKQVDINDKIYYSDVIIISTQGSGTFNIFPNPATNVIQFSLSQPVKSSVQLTIYNTMGVLMKNTSFTANTGQQDISNLTPGTYTIQITDRDSKKPVLSGKFIKL